MSKAKILSGEKAEKMPRRSWLRRPRFQYSISSLLLLTAIFALWLGYVTNRAHKQRAAVAALSAIGAEIEYDWQFNDGIRDHQVTPPGPEWLRKLIGDEYFQEVVEVSLRGLSKPVDFSRENIITSDELEDPFGLNEEKIVFTEEYLNYLKSFPRLRSLDIATDCPSFPAGFWNNFLHLKSFSLSDGYVDDDEVFGDKELVGISVLEELTSLSLSSEGISAAGLKEIGGLRKLEDLSLSCFEVTDEDLSHFENLKNLRHLKLMFFNVDKQFKGDGLKYLPTGLEYLELGGAFEDINLKHLRHLQSLYELEIENDVITDEELWALSYLENLCELKIATVKYLGRDLEALRNLEKLEHLNLSGANLNGQDIAKLGCLPNLTDLTLSCEGLDGEDMMHFEQLKSVTHLTLWCRSITEENLVHLKKMPKLQVIGLPACDVPDKHEKTRIERRLRGIQIYWGH